MLIRKKKYDASASASDGASAPAAAPAPDTRGTVSLQKTPPVSAKWNLYRDGVTKSLLETFMACPERFRLKYVSCLNMTGTESNALQFGNIVHAALDMLYTAIGRRIKAGTLGDTPDIDGFVYHTVAYIAEQERTKLNTAINPAPDSADSLEENVGLAEVLLKEYFRIWFADYANYEWLALEYIFDVPFATKKMLSIDRPDIRIRGKFDGIVRIGSSRQLWLFETKTKSNIEQSAIADVLPFDLQTNLYLRIAHAIYNERPEGVIYNLIKRPQLRRKKSESLRVFVERCKDDIRANPDAYFVRLNCAISESDMARWNVEFLSIMRAIIAWNDGAFHYRNSGACSINYRTCEFLPICSREQRLLFRQRPEVFPELQETNYKGDSNATT